MKCTHAEKTDVYIGLDYPAKASHQVGYNKISSYLNIVQSNHKFKSLTIIKREYNYGLGANGNSWNLINFVLQKYDRFIFSEDDNIFSPCFLDYINKGLYKFRNDSSILGICGYRHFYNLSLGQNTFFKQDIDFSAWGYGMWKNRVEELTRLDTKWFRQKFSLTNFFKIRNSYGNNRAKDFWCVSLPNPKFVLTDNVLSTYMQLNDKFVIMPSETLVRNIGTDGSGEHFSNENIELSRLHLNQKLSSNSRFDFNENEIISLKRLRQEYKSQSYQQISSYKLAILMLLIFCKRIYLWSKSKFQS